MSLNSTPSSYMPLFRIDKEGLSAVSQSNFGVEKDLQRLVENSLPAVFQARFVATEFSTGSFHGGRIDTLALSEDNNPIIIEYKKVESSELINQSLYYLFWLRDHRGDFDAATRAKYGDAVLVDWSDTRVICLAPNYKKYDLLAAQVMGVNLELWRYRLFADGHLYLEEVYRRPSNQMEVVPDPGKDLVMVAAGKKAALTRATGSYTFGEHLEEVSGEIKNLALEIQEYISGLDDAIQEAPKQDYIAYKLTRNFVCMEIRAHSILLFLKLDPKTLPALPPKARDVTNIGHQGTGNLELRVDSLQDFEVAKPMILDAYRLVAGSASLE